MYAWMISSEQYLQNCSSFHNHTDLIVHHDKVECFVKILDCCVSVIVIVQNFIDCLTEFKIPLTVCQSCMFLYH